MELTLSLVGTVNRRVVTLCHGLSAQAFQNCISVNCNFCPYKLPVKKGLAAKHAYNTKEALCGSGFFCTVII